MNVTPTVKSNTPVLVLSIIALALAVSTLGYIVIAPARTHSGSCTGTFTNTANGYTEQGSCTYSDGTVCHFTQTVGGSSISQQQNCP